MQKILLVLVFIFCTPVFAQSEFHHPKETEVAAYFESIKNQPDKLKRFLTGMPKGGDLHNHLTGAVYAENMFRYAKNDNLCINKSTYTVFEDANCSSDNRFTGALRKLHFYNLVIDAWSMRNFTEKKESGHDHFFSVFPKIDAIAKKHQGEMLAEVTKRAALHNVSYLELILSTDFNASGKIGKETGWNPDFDVMKKKLLEKDFQKIVQSGSAFLDEIERKKDTVLACNSHFPDAGCKLKVRYQYEVYREQDPEMVFAQLLAGFETASRDSRVVGINIVQPEDGTISMRDYKLHMRMFAFFHELYPNVHYSLHAGELNEGLVSEDGLSFHIHDAIFVANANRIGHGVDIVHENEMEKILTTMSRRNIPVEINMSSNASILNVEGKNHPLSLYLQYEVPVALSTDDEGISRSNISREYELAVKSLDLDYSTLKTFARNGLNYAFLSGKSLWIDKKYSVANEACQNEVPGSNQPSRTCKSFLEQNEKASLQWDLEKRFIQFEVHAING